MSKKLIFHKTCYVLDIFKYLPKCGELTLDLKGGHLLPDQQSPSKYEIGQMVAFDLSEIYSGFEPLHPSVSHIPSK
ncbi:hypothetical protein CEXT_269241 [Caerostris extrusa]|uniref:Uncharacterized protein n=1 Tax=Caerostris extrusa TaxID=172846 RepID=A0AAV4MYX7_CAEEX|nr:hypothetical protein CEXT_269241 [Caerostris extrusa]